MRKYTKHHEVWGDVLQTPSNKHQLQLGLVSFATANELWHDKTNKKMSVRPAKTQISPGICPVWSESSLCVQWAAKDLRFLHADGEDSDQTGRMHRLIWVFAGRTFILLVLSCRGSNGFVFWKRFTHYNFSFSIPFFTDIVFRQNF